MAIDNNVLVSLRKEVHGMTGLKLTGHSHYHGEVIEDRGQLNVIL